VNFQTLVLGVEWTKLTQICRYQSMWPATQVNSAWPSLRG